MSKRTKPAPATPATAEQNAIAALIDNPIVEGYEVKEWSISQFSRLYPYFRQVSAGFTDLTVDNATSFITKNPMVFIDAIVPILPEVLEISLSITKEEVEKISATRASILAMAILKKNMEHLTNFLAQIRGSIGALLPSQTTN